MPQEGKGTPVSNRKSSRKIIVVDDFDHIPGVAIPTIAGNQVQISGNRVSLTGYTLPRRLSLDANAPPALRSRDGDGISDYLPQGARLFVPTADFKNLEKADDYFDRNKKGRKDSLDEDNTNIYVYDDSIWTINPDEPLLEETTHEYDRTRRTFFTFFSLSLLIVGILLASLYTWVFKYGGGVIVDSSISNATIRAKEEMKKYYNIHGLVLLTSVFTLHFENILIFRVFLNVPKFRLKCIHATTATIGAVGVIIGLIYGMKGHAVHNDGIFTSMHGCIGIMTMALYEVQYLLGLSIFLLPCTPIKLRVQFGPMHKFLGGMTFLCAVTSVVTGIVVIIKVFIPLRIHSQLPLQSILLNSVGVMTVFYGMLITFLMMTRKFRRRRRPVAYMSLDPRTQRMEEQQLETGENAGTQVSGEGLPTGFLNPVKEVQIPIIKLSAIEDDKVVIH